MPITTAYTPLLPERHPSAPSGDLLGEISSPHCWVLQSLTFSTQFSQIDHALTSLHFERPSSWSLLCLLDSTSHDPTCLYLHMFAPTFSSPTLIEFPCIPRTY